MHMYTATWALQTRGQTRARVYARILAIIGASYQAVTL